MYDFSLLCKSRSLIYQKTIKPVLEIRIIIVQLNDFVVIEQSFLNEIIDCDVLARLLL